MNGLWIIWYRNGQPNCRMYWQMSSVVFMQYNQKQVLKIDGLSNEYIRTAKEAYKEGKQEGLVKLEDKLFHLIQGDATNLPFDDESFDIVWTQHVQMNIANEKQQFYSEIHY